MILKEQCPTFPNFHPVETRKAKATAEGRLLSGSGLCFRSAQARVSALLGSFLNTAFLPSTTMRLSEKGFSNIFPTDQKTVQKLSRMGFGTEQIYYH